PLGLHGDPPVPELFVSETEEDAMARRLAKSGIDKSAFVIGINPGSIYGGAKRWLPDRFADATERLCQAIRQTHAKDAAGRRGWEMNLPPACRIEPWCCLVPRRSAN